jgi:hypothetical protein
MASNKPRFELLTDAFYFLTVAITTQFEEVTVLNTNIVLFVMVLTAFFENSKCYI